MVAIQELVAHLEEDRSRRRVFTNYASGAAVGMAGALVATLATARILSPAIADLFLAQFAPTLRDLRLAEAKASTIYALTIALVILICIAWGCARSRWESGAFDLIPPILAFTLGASGSPALGLASLAAILLVAPLVEARVPREDYVPPSIPEIRIASALLLLGAEAVTLGWGAWLATRPGDMRMTAGVMVTFLGCVGFVVASTSRGRRLQTLTACALTCAPVLSYAVLGVMRTPPNMMTLGVLTVVTLLVSAWLQRRAGMRGLSAFAHVLAPVAMITIAIIPLGMRFLPSSNHASHEAFHAGWIQGALDGRFFQADVDTVYGLLREWILMAYLALAGFTLENLRVAHVLVNIAGASMLVVAAFPYLDARPLLTTMFAYALVIFSPLRCLAHYELGISIGWVDLSRCAFAAMGLLGSIRAREKVEQATAGPIQLFAWGAVCGAATLYSQEFGAVATLATWICYVVAPVLSKRKLPPLKACGIALGTHASGCAATLLCTLAVYSAFDKGQLLLETWLLMSQLLGGGGVGFWAGFPLTAASFLNPLDILRSNIGDSYQFSNSDAEYLLAPATYAIALAGIASAFCQRTWDARRTEELALTIFGAAVFRVTLSRPDSYHMLSALTPAVMLALALAHRALEGRSTRQARIFVLALVAVCVLSMTEKRIGIVQHVRKLRGRAVPSTPPPIHLDRAGHIRVEPGVVEVVRYLRENTLPSDSLFVRGPGLGLDGPHLYFLADRRLPTRFAMTQELWTPELQDEALRSLERDPPAFVVGRDEVVVGRGIAEFVDRSYTLVRDDQKWPIFKRRENAPTAR